MIQQHLFALQDTAYRDFQARLVPSVDKGRIIGVRVPQLRKLATQLYGTPEADAFLRELPHMYYDEDLLHGFLLEKIRDFDACVAAVDAFLPYVDNWAVCDCMSPKCFKKNPGALDKKIPQWLASDHVYTVRYAIGMRMRYFLQEPYYAREVLAVQNDDYYVRMMVAWYLATALSVNFDAYLPYLEQLDPRTLKMTLQKVRDSYRITREQKIYLCGGG